MEKIIFPVFLAVAILMLAIAALSAAITTLALSREHTTPGRVVDLVERKNESGQTFYYPVVEFYLPGERRQTVQTSAGSWPPAYQKGEAVTIAYDPERPLNARIKSFSSTIIMWIVPMITGFLAAAFLIATVGVRWLFKQSHV